VRLKDAFLDPPGIVCGDSTRFVMLPFFGSFMICGLGFPLMSDPSSPVSGLPEDASASIVKSRRSRHPIIRWLRRRSPQQQLLLGYTLYVAIGTSLLCLPFAQAVPVRFIDNLFGATSAMSTTGLVTVATGDTYTFFGELVHLVLMQLGGIGYMTLTSFILLAGGRSLHRSRQGVLNAGFTLPHYFRIDHFIKQVIAFTLVIEIIGAVVLYVAFRNQGVEAPLWSAVFHSISAFATAGFSLYSNSLESFRDDPLINITIGMLSYAGAIGFIVMQDLYYSLRYRERMLTFTSKVILFMTALIFVVGTIAFFVVEPSVRELPFWSRLQASAFQIMTASSTAGFNTVPIGALGLGVLWLIVIVMIIGASPSGTGGGIKTTSVSAMLATIISVARGREQVTLLGNEIPIRRVLASTAATMLYLVLLALGVIALAITEDIHNATFDVFASLIFEAASALGTVGLSMGITASLSDPGKIVIILLMFLGRLGPLTLGIAMLRRRRIAHETRSSDDLAA
jgi:trk system potassium uptake protein